MLERLPGILIPGRRFVRIDLPRTTKTTSPETAVPSCRQVGEPSSTRSACENTSASGASGQCCGWAAQAKPARKA